MLKEIHTILAGTLGEHAPLNAVKNWVAQFKCGNFSTTPGRPKTVTTTEIIDQIHELILEDCQISAKSIAEQLRISREQVGSFHEDFDMRKLSVKWVPKCLNVDQKVNSANCLSNFWNFFSAIQTISCHDWWQWTKPGYITMARRQSKNHWSSGIVAHPALKNFKCKNPLENFSP